MDPDKATELKFEAVANLERNLKETHERQTKTQEAEAALADLEQEVTTSVHEIVCNLQFMANNVRFQHEAVSSIIERQIAPERGGNGTASQLLLFPTHKSDEHPVWARFYKVGPDDILSNQERPRFGVKFYRELKLGERRRIHDLKDFDPLVARNAVHIEGRALQQLAEEDVDLLPPQPVSVSHLTTLHAQGAIILGRIPLKEHGEVFGISEGAKWESGLLEASYGPTMRQKLRAISATIKHLGIPINELPFAESELTLIPLPLERQGRKVLSGEERAFKGPELSLISDASTPTSYADPQGNLYLPDEGFLNIPSLLPDGAERVQRLYNLANIGVAEPVAI